MVNLIWKVLWGVEHEKFYQKYVKKEVEKCEQKLDLCYFKNHPYAFVLCQILSILIVVSYELNVCHLHWNYTL